MPAQRALVLVNREARSGNADLAAALTLLRERGFDLVDKVADAPAQIPELIRRHAGDVDLVVLGGGDGTMNLAAEAVRESGLPLGILPLGTANDLARTLGIPPSLGDACEIIARGRRLSVDLGCVNGKLFFNVASMGLSVAVARRLTGEIKRRWGVLGYPISVLDACRPGHVFKARVTHNGGTETLRSIQLAVGNGRFYGGGMAVAEDAAINDQRLDLYSLEPQSLWKLATLLPFLRLGRHGAWNSVHCLQGEQFEIHTDPPMAINTDGELTTKTPARFHVVPKALSIFVPDTQLSGGTKESHAA